MNTAWKRWKERHPLSVEWARDALQIESVGRIVGSMLVAGLAALIAGLWAGSFGWQNLLIGGLAFVVAFALLYLWKLFTVTIVPPPFGGLSPFHKAEERNKARQSQARNDVEMAGLNQQLRALDQQLGTID